MRLSVGTWRGEVVSGHLAHPDSLPDSGACQADNGVRRAVACSGTSTGGVEAGAIAPRVVVMNRLCVARPDCTV